MPGMVQNRPDSRGFMRQPRVKAAPGFAAASPSSRAPAGINSGINLSASQDLWVLHGVPRRARAGLSGPPSSDLITRRSRVQIPPPLSKKGLLMQAFRLRGHRRSRASCYQLATNRCGITRDRELWVAHPADEHVDRQRLSTSSASGWGPEGRWFKSSRPDWANARSGSGRLAGAACANFIALASRCTRHRSVPRVLNAPRRASLAAIKRCP
jgi:hypothetical protein